MNKKRCAWCASNVDPINLAYHDKKWGVPIYKDRLLFEFLVLEGMQAGLSWLTILKKRKAFRVAFCNFDYKKVAKFDQRKINSLLNNADIIRNKLKITAAVDNAKAVLQIQTEWDSFANYIWHFVGNRPVQNHWKSSTQVPAKTSISDLMAKDLKKHGFKFVGSTICYASCKQSAW